MLLGGGVQVSAVGAVEVGGSLKSFLVLVAQFFIIGVDFGHETIYFGLVRLVGVLVQSFLSL